MDAQRHEVFAALYPSEGDLVPLDGPVSEPPDRVLARWRALAGDRQILVAGDGVDRYRSLLAEHAGEQVRVVDPLPPLAPTIARIAVVEAAAGRAMAPHAVRPIYVRRPDAELARERKEPTLR
jgi:tRNA A37 threonylcarbamoyladenosine modification protein TsaB